MRKIIFLSTLLCFIVTNINGETVVKYDSPSVTILIPNSKERAYEIAGTEFAQMWKQVTGNAAVVDYMRPDQRKLPKGNVVLIGSDAVNPIVHQFIIDAKIEKLDIKYGADNYHILSVDNDGQECLVLAGGNGRSTIYAVYDFFQKQAGVGYFWDGDVIQQQDQIPLTSINISEHPRFEYRGLRYFAHRGLHRFQAEHWDLTDWKKEIDWIMKKRFNLFMLRTGIDDLFQRAFPKDVPYPPADEQDPDAVERSFDDRTSFWPLKYRGELRKQVLQYARERGLMHPEDIGTITHWYSHTPSSFYKNKPDFPVIINQRPGNYTTTTHAIWDIESQEAWNAYWKLTQTHIKEFGGGLPRLFHTIGMAERVFGKNDRENLLSKLYVYRKTQQRLRENYPDAPLLVGSWDFTGWNWNNQDVQELIKEFNPKRTIILDYTADKGNKITYKDWKTYKKFPWIFGIFHSLAKHSDIHEDYSILAPRLKEAADDPLCKGLVTWSELSHSDTYLLEYFASNSWQPKNLELEQATDNFCNLRYPKELSKEMNQIWTTFLPISQTFHWGFDDILYEEPQFRVLTTKPLIDFSEENILNLKKEVARVNAGLTNAPTVLAKLRDLTNSYYDNPAWKRDAIDMARTIANRALFVSLAQTTIEIDSWNKDKSDAKDIHKLVKLSQELLSSLSDILVNSDDFSMHSSLQKLNKADQINGIYPMINPHTEQTLKGNAEVDYCRSHHYELVEHVYQPELKVYGDWILKQIKSSKRKEWKRPEIFKVQGNIIKDKFYDTPLAEMAPIKEQNRRNLIEGFSRLHNEINDLLPLCN